MRSSRASSQSRQCGTRLGKQFDQDQEKAKQFEEDLLAEANLRGKLERQRALFSTVVDQLKQAQFVSDYSSITAQVIEPAQTPLRPGLAPGELNPGLGPGGRLRGGDGGCGGVRSPGPAGPLARRAPPVDGSGGARPGGALARGPVRRDGPARPDQLRQASLVLGRGVPGHPDQHRLPLRRNQRLQVLLVTSFHAGDGKTTAASNLAISFALAGRRVLLIDTDLRRPSLHKVHGLRIERGLSQLLKDLLPLHQGVQRSKIENLEVITTGPEVPNPAELLSSPHLAELLDEARQAYDVIVIDSPPLLAVADPAIVGAVVDGVILVAQPKTAPAPRRRARPGAAQEPGDVPPRDAHQRGRPRGQGLWLRLWPYGYGSYGRPSERRSGDATWPIGAEDQPPETVTRANGQPGPGLHNEPD